MFNEASDLADAADPRPAEPGELARLVDAFEDEAQRRDGPGTAPVEALGALRDRGMLAAPVRRELGGSGWGSEPDGAQPLLNALRTIGRGNLSLGRIYEGHVNALALIMAYGSSAQRVAAARDARAGHLFAVWVTDGPAPVLVGVDQRLEGAKRFCSAAPIATRALITARVGAATRMLLVHLDAGGRMLSEPSDTQGMRGCATANVDFTGVFADPAWFIGAPGDYLRQPVFSAGAWRASAVALGGLDALVDATMAQLRARSRERDPHQAARIGALLIARETAALWGAKAARIAEADDGDAEATVAYVNLARTAIESAIVGSIQLAQRSLGLAAFVRPNAVERLCRDLATYVRQPAPDEALTEAAGWFAAHADPLVA